MRVAILHYHLRPGGVTRVIDNTVQSLAGTQVQLALLTGEEPSGDFHDGLVRTVPAIGYQQDGDPRALLSELDLAASQMLGGAPDLWHIHNHSLGKNLALPKAARALALRGDPVVLQPHDFAEDFRGSNYRALLDGTGLDHAPALHRWLYPVADHVHYALLTSRDRDALASCGLPADRLHLLPNAIALAGAGDLKQTTTRSGVRVYPTRAIRRKNLGEFLLWALLEPSDEWWITLAPTSTEDRLYYDRWKAWTAQHKLPVRFEAGVNRPLSEVLAEAGAVISTSITEGFGLAFAEPWLAGKPLCGRALRDITKDLETDGLDLSCLYDEVRVPADLLPEAALRQAVQDALVRIHKAFGLPLPDHAMDQALTMIRSDQGIEFGRIGENLQSMILQRLAEDPGRAAGMKPRTLAPWDPDDPRILQNRDLLVSQYGLSAYRERLLTLYQSVLAAPISTVEAPAGDRTLLDCFLAPEKLHIARS
ncbi:MAG: glycosyltransferase family 4 protein [Verrucomicrobia bacterium]|nr:glycosyltransferase family 4 protein [Verrucomicrobiota bacterium]